MGYPYSKKYFIDCLKSKPSGVSCVCLWVPTLTPKVPFLARVSREGLTADNHSVILNSVVIVVDVGAAASVKELLIATVVGVTAPEGVEMGRQMQAGSPHPKTKRRPWIIYFNPSQSALQTAVQRGIVTHPMSHSIAEQALASYVLVLDPTSLPYHQGSRLAPYTGAQSGAAIGVRCPHYQVREGGRVGRKPLLYNHRK